MKLHAVNWEFFVTDCHDDFFIGFVCSGSYLEAVWELCGVNREGVVTHDCERAGDSCEEAGGVMGDL